MADKEVIINGHNMLHGTGVKDSEDTSTNSTPCFDEVLTQGAKQTGGTLEIDRLIFESKEEYDWLSAELRKMKSEHGMITTRQIIRVEKPYVIIKNFTGCILNGKDFEMKPEEHSAQNLKFIWEACDERTEYIYTYNGPSTETVMSKAEKW